MIISGNEKKTSFISGIPVGFYYYLIPNGDGSIYNANYLGYVDTIQSVTYNPFIEKEDIIRIVECIFNSDKYGIPDGGIPKCYRIESFDKIEKTIGNLNLFHTKDEGTYGDGLNYDPKLQCFPFRYYLLTDYVNTPLLIKPELVKSYSNKLIIKVTTSALSMESKYNLSVENYKGDDIGNIEGINSNNTLMLPVTSSIYSQFVSSSMASFNQGNINAMLENDKTLNQGLATSSMNYNINQIQNNMSGLNGMIGMLANGLMGNIGGAIGTGINTMLNVGVNSKINSMQTQLTQSQLNENHQLTEYEINTMAQARVTDMLNTPNSIKTSGNDTLFNLINSRRKVDLIEYGPKDDKIEKINMYLTRYGYRCNRYMKLSRCINSRKYYNFVKTSSCNLRGDKVPIQYLEEFKAIFNRGVTIWHIDNGAVVQDYEYTNMEV